MWSVAQKVKSESIFALRVSSSQSESVFWSGGGVWLDAWNKVFGYHKLKTYTRFVFRHKVCLGPRVLKKTVAKKWLNETAEVIRDIKHLMAYCRDHKLFLQ